MTEARAVPYRAGFMAVTSGGHPDERHVMPVKEYAVLLV